MNVLFVLCVASKADHIQYIDALIDRKDEIDMKIRQKRSLWFGNDSNW